MTEKEKFLRQFNDAFIAKDHDLIFDSMTEDIRWTMVGDVTFEGKEEARKAMESMPDMNIETMHVDRVITHGADAAVHGTMIMNGPNGSRSTYVYCDLYKFRGFKNPKIRELISFVVKTEEG